MTHELPDLHHPTGRGRLGLSDRVWNPGSSAVSLLRRYQPVSFQDRCTSEHITIEQLCERMLEAEAKARAEAEEARALRAERLREYGRKQLAVAYARPDGAEVIAEGRWAGFTRADAIAWCWNLFQYEPRGFTHPGSEVRARAVQLLLEGGLPEVFGYPERAGELRDHGLAPIDYRHHQESLGARVFDGAELGAL